MHIHDIHAHTRYTRTHARTHDIHAHTHYTCTHTHTARDWNVFCGSVLPNWWSHHSDTLSTPLGSWEALPPPSTRGHCWIVYPTSGAAFHLVPLRVFFPVFPSSGCALPSWVFCSSSPFLCVSWGAFFAFSIASRPNFCQNISRVIDQICFWLVIIFFFFSDICGATTFLNATHWKLHEQMKWEPFN